MPSDVKGGRGRGAIYNWRVKEGKKKGEVFSDPSKFKCTIFIKENQKNYQGKLRLISPNW